MQRRSRNLDWLKYILRHERELYDAVLEAKLGTKGRSGGSSGGRYFVSDPTPAMALRRAEEVGCVVLRDKSRVQWPERWLKVIDSIRKWCQNDPIDEALFSWVLIQPKLKRSGAKLRQIKMCSDLHIEKDAYYKRLATICVYGAGVADGLGIE